MPMYYFNARDGEELPDHEGTELKDNNEARLSAPRYLAELLSEQPHLLLETGTFELTVTSDQGLSLFVFDLSVTAAPAAAGLK